MQYLKIEILFFIFKPKTNYRAEELSLTIQGYMIYLFLCKQSFTSFIRGIEMIYRKRTIFKDNIKEYLVLIIIFIIAFKISLSVWSFGTPNYPNVDENITINIVNKLYVNKTFILDYFRYPALNFYYGEIFLHIVSKITKLDIQNSLVIILRVIYNGSALFSFIFFYFAIKRLFRRKVAYMSLLLALFSLYYQRYIYYAGPDTLLILFSNILIYVGALIYTTDNEEKNIYFLIPLFCILLACATAVKYNGIVFIVMLIFLYIYKEFYKSYKNNFILLLSLILIPLFFVIFNFCIFIDFNKFLQDVIWNFNHYKGTHQGLDSSMPSLAYLKIFLKSQYGIFGLILTFLGLYNLLNNKQYSLLIFILIVPAITILILSKYNLMLERNISTIMPFNTILICLGMIFLENNFWKDKQHITLCLVGLLVVLNITMITYFYSFNQSRNIASIWISENIPEDSVIYLSKGDYSMGYLPLVDSKKYSIKDEVPEMLNDNEYLIMTEYRYGRYSNREEKLFVKGKYLYSASLQKYNKQISKYSVLKEFPGLSSFGNTSIKNEIGYLDIFKYKRKVYYDGPTINIYQELK